MAASADRQAPGSPIRLLPAATLAASTTVYAGTMVAKIPAGTHRPAANAAGYVVRGIAANKAALPSTDLVADEVVIMTGPFDMINSGTDPVTAADIGSWVYVEDDQTICRKPTGYGRRAGILEDVPSSSVATVFFGPPQVEGDGYNATEVASGALSPEIRYQEVTVTGTVAYTLADGTAIGQRVTFICIAAGGTPHGVLTPTSKVGYAAIEFDTIGDTCTLRWTGAAWAIESNGGCVVT